MSAIPEGPFDPGLQAERTLLSWKRTCLSLGVAVAVAVRFAAEALGPAVTALAAVGIGTALAAYLSAARRYRAAHAELSRTRRLPVDGVAPALLTATLVLLGLSAGAFVIGGSWR